MKRIDLCNFAKHVLAFYQLYIKEQHQPMNQPQEISNSYCVLVVWVTNCFNSSTIQWSPLKNLSALETFQMAKHVTFLDFSGILVFENFLKGPIQHLLVQSQQWKHQNNVPNMFKVNNKETRTTLMTLLWCLYCCYL